MKYPKFAKEMAKLRSFRGKTVYEVAEYVGVSHTYISQMENGKKLPSLKVMYPLVYFLGSKNDKGYINKVENTEYDGTKLLDVYSEYKGMNKEEIASDYLEYIRFLTLDNFNEMIELGEAREKNEISIDTNTSEIKKMDKPYFDLKWLLNQRDSHVFYGKDYDIQGYLDNDLNKKIYESDIYSVLKDEDIKTIKEIIEAYISNKYRKVSKDDIKNRGD